MLMSVGRIRLGHSPYPHFGIEALRGHDADADYARQQRECCALENQCESGFPGVDHSAGTQCQTSLAPRKNASAKIQLPTSTKRNGH